ncbi:hypothetical protein ACVOMV_17525 [Mesorhizobium atlanticum]
MANKTRQATPATTTTPITARTKGRATLPVAKAMEMAGLTQP